MNAKIGIFLAICVTWASAAGDSFSSGLTIRLALLAQDRRDISIETIVDLHVLGYGLLTRSLGGGSDERWVRMSSTEANLYGQKISDLDKRIKIVVVHPKLERASHPAQLFMELKSITAVEAIAIGGWRFISSDRDADDTDDRTYMIKFVYLDGEWKILKVTEASDKELYPYLHLKDDKSEPTGRQEVNPTGQP